MDRRRLMFMGLAGALTAAIGMTTAASAAVLGDTTGLSQGPVFQADANPLVEEVQYNGRGRGRRCSMETRNVRFRDRHGRVRMRQVQQRVCR